VPAPTTPADTYNKALEVLARGPKSAKDLARWLLRREHQPADISAAIEKLTERGLINDAAYSVMFARSRFTTHHMSRRRIGAELAKRGVERSIADAAIAEVIGDEEIDESAMVDEAAAKKFRSLAKYEPDVQRRRLYAFLARKGFAPELVKSAVAKLTRGEPR